MLWYVCVCGTRWCNKTTHGSGMMIYASSESMALCIHSLDFLWHLLMCATMELGISPNGNNNARSSAQSMGATNGRTFVDCTLWERWGTQRIPPSTTVSFSIAKFKWVSFKWKHAKHEVKRCCGIYCRHTSLSTTITIGKASLALGIASIPCIIPSCFSTSTPWTIEHCWTFTWLSSGAPTSRLSIPKSVVFTVYIPLYPFTNE